MNGSGHASGGSPQGTGSAYAVNAQGASNSAGVGHTAPPPGSSGDRVQLTAEQKAALNPLLKFVHQYMKRIAEMYPNVEPHLRTSMSNLVSVYGGRELTKAELSQLLLSFRSDMEQLFGPERGKKVLDGLVKELHKREQYRRSTSPAPTLAAQQVPPGATGSAHVPSTTQPNFLNGGPLGGFPQMQQLVGQRVLSPSPGAAYPPGRAPSPVPYGFAGPSGSQAPEPYNNIMQAQQAQRIQTQQIQIQQAHLPQQQSGPARVSSDPSGNDAGAPAAKQMKPKSAGTKRAAEGAPGDKPKEAKRSAQRKGKASDQDADAGAEKLNFFEEERETNIAMADLERHRRSGQAKACPVQLLSEWRLANEILRQMKAKGISGGQGGPAKAGASPDGATGSGASPSEVSIGFDEPLLAALQHAFKAHAQGLLTRAARAAQHRVVTSQKVPGFERGEDPRPRLGQIRKREEAAADAKAAEEREALLRAAGSRRADDETRERAQRAKAEMAGQQQAKAANKALAATLGGKDAKWAKWGGGAKKPGAAPSAKAAAEQGPEAAAAAAAAEENGHTTTMVTAAEELARAGAGGSLSAPRPPPVEAPGGGGGLEGAKVSVNDLIVALQQDPGYCNSAILYRLMNGMV